MTQMCAFIITGICGAYREYNIALRTELRRKETQAEDPKRAAELAAYFTHANLQRPHVALTLRSAMATFAKLRNYNTCATFCRRLLELNAGQKVKVLVDALPTVLQAYAHSMPMTMDGLARHS